MASEKEYTLEEVARHNSPSDLWMVMDGQVYDLTKFLSEHPGGEEVLLINAGQDGTTCFNDMGHSDEAVQLRETFRIGYVSGKSPSGRRTKTSTPSASTPTTTTADDDTRKHKKTNDDSSMLPILVTIGILAYSVAYFYMF